MNSIDNSKKVERSDLLEQSFQSAINNGAAVNVYEQAQFFRNAASANDKPRLVEARTSLETETLWKKRLFMLLEAENKLLKVIRLRKITGIFTVLSVAVFIFSLFVAPSMSPKAFYSLVAVAAFGIATYPAWFLLSKSNRKRRDQISSLFYKSNHEVETADGKMTLINRANYASVTQIHILDRKLGLFPNT
ncbi:hypothetical protein ACI7YQ_16120 [Alteromonas marina]|uniref:hypothetical protein n=1 Tax=unclassified Alteromonas TaxID=2614992 RepID=UPI0012E6B0FE|nr:hypothetical protein [Alteromonas sp. KUL150]GFD76405.1 hypothetical protein KUL113_58250 [Tenacibaculum sp. KUL113]GFD87475.1 hypothetical protein KUL150_35340 [Alteromonas sp. KUL150]|tara:strand:+ start:276 stop:848 length:573 start_codon:yes stop_codon:yes gene_type:complete